MYFSYCMKIFYSFFFSLEIKEQVLFLLFQNSSNLQVISLKLRWKKKERNERKAIWIIILDTTISILFENIKNIWKHLQTLKNVFLINTIIETCNDLFWNIFSVMKHDLYSQLLDHKKTLPLNFSFIWLIL